MAEFDGVGGGGVRAEEEEEEIDIGEDNIIVASTNGDIARVQVLLDAGESVNYQDEHGFSPLHAAVSYGETEMIEFLLSRGADINLVDEDGDVPILASECASVFELLIRAGADPKAVNAQGEGILQKAFEDENEEFVKYLCEQGYAPPGFVFEMREAGDMEDIDEDEDEEEGEGEQGQKEQGQAAAAMDEA